MKHYPPRPPRVGPVTRRRIPPFHPVPVGPRADGWTPLRQAQFIGYLAETRSVAAACRRVGMGREGAYRLRRRPGAAGFAAAWDAALGVAGHTAIDHASTKAKGLEPGERWQSGRLQVVMDRGRFVRVTRKPDFSALLQHIARLDRACAGIDAG